MSCFIHLHISVYMKTEISRLTGSTFFLLGDNITVSCAMHAHYCMFHLRNIKTTMAMAHFCVKRLYIFHCVKIINYGI